MKLYTRARLRQVSEWIDPDSKEPAVAKASSEALKQEMGWATHLSLQGVMLRLRSADSVGFAHLTNQLLQGIHHMQVELTFAVLMCERHTMCSHPATIVFLRRLPPCGLIACSHQLMARWVSSPLWR
jgi:hypothetical protein